MPRPAQIVLIGMKSSGKTTAGRALARKLGVRFADMDSEIERLHAERKGEQLSFRDIFRAHGQAYFRQLETAALEALAARLRDESFVLATGGGLPLAEENRATLRRLGAVVFLDVSQEVLLPRIVAGGIPAFFPYPEDPAKSLAELLERRRPVYRDIAGITVGCGRESPEEVAEAIVREWEEQHGKD